MKGKRVVPKTLRSSMETLIVSIDQVNEWKIPPFQRPLRVNAKLIAIAEDLKTNGVEITGVITLGKLTGDETVWVVDGQHRLEAFRMSGLAEVICDIRVVTFETMVDMSDEFVRLNSVVARMRPDDILRGLEPSLPMLQTIRKECPFVGYDQVRRGGTSGPVLGMALVMRCWRGSDTETPVGNSNGASAQSIAQGMNPEGTEQLIRFLTVANASWGRDVEYYRLWGGLNLTMCMWLYRQLVMTTDRRGNKWRIIVLNIAQFKQCLMSVSASSDYLDWLPGHLMCDRDRSPCFNRLKAIFGRRLQSELGDKKRLSLPQPAWS